jgi:hypothetical protein
MGLSSGQFPGRCGYTPPERGASSIPPVFAGVTGPPSDPYDALSIRSLWLLLERSNFLLERDLILDRVGMVLPLNP